MHFDVSMAFGLQNDAKTMSRVGKPEVLIARFFRVRLNRGGLSQ
jgi:hypothetical protein